jgi:hypothetical protein
LSYRSWFDNGGQLHISTTTNATSTATGALQVTGGVGIGGSVYAAAVYDNNNRVVTSVVANGSTYIGISNLISTGTSTSFTINNLGVQTLTAGTDTVVSSATGTVVVWSNSTLQSVTARGATTNSAISITNTSSSTSTTTGALTVTGGVGIGGNLNVGGTVSANNMNINTFDWEHVIEKIEHDNHTQKQVDFIYSIPQDQIVWLKFDDQLKDNFINLMLSYGCDVEIKKSDRENTTKENSAKHSVIDKIVSKIGQHPEYRQKIIDYYHEDYALINSVKFYKKQ